MIIVTLGPAGTFSHAAALAYNKDAEIVFEKTIPKVFKYFKDHNPEVAIVPIENSLSGFVTFTTDNLLDFKFPIIGEIILPIEHHLAGFGEIKDITVLYSHPHSYAQCEKNLINLLQGDVQVHFTVSNTESALLIKEKNNPSIGAIIPQIASELYQIPLLKNNIEDSNLNQTRFLVIGRESVEATGHDRTSIILIPEMNVPGVLYRMLKGFADRAINLTKIESRPSKLKLGEYIFFADVHGHYQDTSIREALKEVEGICRVKILGSYPRMY